MLTENYIAINKTLRTIHAQINEIVGIDIYEGDGYGKNAIKALLRRTISDLKSAIEEAVPESLESKFQDLENKFSQDLFEEIQESVLPEIENELDCLYSESQKVNFGDSFLGILHPRILAASYRQYQMGEYRDAVLNSIIAVFDFIRERTGVDADGSALIDQVFSLAAPKLVFTSIDNESGQNDQKGFMQILKGVYQGVRNPKAHSLGIVPSQNVAAQYLVFLSLLARRVEEAIEP